MIRYCLYNNIFSYKKKHSISQTNSHFIYTPSWLHIKLKKVVILFTTTFKNKRRKKISIVAKSNGKMSLRSSCLLEDLRQTRITSPLAFNPFRIPSTEGTIKPRFLLPRRPLWISGRHRTPCDPCIRHGDKALLRSWPVPSAPALPYAPCRGGAGATSCPGEPGPPRSAPRPVGN